MKKITYSEVEKRAQLLEMKNVVAVPDNSRLFYRRLEEKDTLEHATRFVTECAKDANVASYYLEDLQKYVNEYYDDRTIRETFENNIIPMITLRKGDTILEGHDWECLFKRNQVCDRILDNMQLIESKLPIDATIRKRNITNTSWIADLCAEAVCRFEKLDLEAKINIAIEEAVMMIQKHRIVEKHNITLDQYPWVYEEAADRVIKTIKILEDVSAIQMEEAVRSLINSPVVEYTELVSYCNLDKIDKTSHNKALIEFRYDPSAYTFDRLINESLIIARPTQLYTIFESAKAYAASSNGDVVCDVFGELSELPDKFMKKFINVPKGIKLYSTLCSTIEECIGDTEKYIGTLKEAGSDLVERYERYQEILKEVSEKLQEMGDFIYPEYNMRMIQEGVFSRAKGVISFLKASEKLSQIGNKILQARKWIKGKAQPVNVGDKVADALRTAGSTKIFLTFIKRGISKRDTELTENASLYEYLTPEGDFDVIIDRFITVDGVSINSEVLNMFDNLCREMNDNIFRTDSTGCGTYFIATDNIVEVHYFDNERVELTEEQVAIITEQTMSEDFDMPLIYELALYSSMPDDICELTESELISRAADMLLEHKEETEKEFGTFLELASYATIWYDTVQQIFESVCEGMPATFRTQYSYTVESYKPAHPAHVGDEIALEALDMFKDFINEKVDYDEKYGNLDDEEEESEDEDESEEDDEEDDPKKEAKKRINPKKKEKDDEKEGKEKKEKTSTFNNIKLFQMGLKKKMKDLSSKEQSFCRNLDSSFTRLVKAMQQALVSDRREAIIKGSVIPSFSKCIKWGCVMAGTAIVNPVAPVITAIGAFALSKRLTKKERTLLLDDIEIELKVIDKEIGMAESDNNTKKMRALMKEQRNLQRQYQRIKYNIRVGKDIIPGGTGGGND